MESAHNHAGMMWYNYTPVESLITSGPVQVEIGNDIARQINLQYGSMQTVAATQQPAQIILAQGQPTVLSAPSPEPATDMKPPPTPKPRTSRASHGERVVCEECGKSFSCNANLRDHLRLHTGERPFSCLECGMTFAQRSNWRLHKRVHTGERPYMCGVCGKTFSRSSHLPGHMRVHTGERPYHCDECSSSFASAQALKNHLRTHSGEKPFVCEHCNTAFTHSSSLSSHRKRCTGVKRKRGRPLGSGRKINRKKASGRPRGRPRKRGRRGKRGRKKVPLNLFQGDERVGSISTVKVEGGDIGVSAITEETVLHGEPLLVEKDFEKNISVENPIQVEHPDMIDEHEDTSRCDKSPGIEPTILAENVKSENDDQDSVISSASKERSIGETVGEESDNSQSIEIMSQDSDEFSHETLTADKILVPGNIVSHKKILQVAQSNPSVLPVGKLVSVAASAANIGINDTLDLHQEAAVAIASLQQSALNLVQQPQHAACEDVYVDGSSQTVYYSKESY